MFPGGRNGQLPHATERQRKMRTEKDALNCVFGFFWIDTTGIYQKFTMYEITEELL